MSIGRGTRVSARVGVAALAAWALGAAVAAVAAAAEGGPEAAVWVPRELHFTYMGFTTKYSCDGLRDNVQEILLQLGARKQDLKVREGGCINPMGAPDPFPSVNIKMSVLQPAAGSKDTPVNAHWKPINLLARRSRMDAAGQCELYEQVKQHILPLFTVRNLNYSSACVPHQLSIGGQTLTAEVLVADPVRPPAAP